MTESTLRLHRVRRADRALKAYAKTDAPGDVNCVDLLADLGHWSDANRLHFDDLAETAQEHWRRERSDFIPTTRKRSKA